MSEGPISVLVPVDVPFDAEEVLSEIRELLNRPVDLILLHVVDTQIMTTLRSADSVDADEAFAHLRRSADYKLGEAAKSAGAGVQSMVVEGIPFLEIVKLSRDLKVDMIALNVKSKRKGMDQLFFGSTADRVLRGSRIPVLCLP